LYPALTDLPPSLDLTNQFAYRPTGSTTAAIIAILQAITTLLQTNPFVFCYSFDYSKAFDTLSHTAVATTLSQTNIPDNIYNWILSYLHPRSHVTSVENIVSASLNTSAGIVQGSVLGPTLFNVNSASLKPLHQDNLYFKYADDDYLLVPSKNSSTIQSELLHHASLASGWNLKLNPSKTAEIIFPSKKVTPLPPLTPGVNRIETIKILGVVLDRRLNFTLHVNSQITSCSQSLFALRTMRHHGMSEKNLQLVFSSTIIPRLLYAASAYWGFLSAHSRSCLEAFLRRAIKFGYYPSTGSDISALVNKSDLTLFNSILDNSTHVLHHLLPPKKNVKYNLRSLTHGLTLPPKDHKNFLPRMLYLNIY